MKLNGRKLYFMKKFFLGIMFFTLINTTYSQTLNKEYLGKWTADINDESTWLKIELENEKLNSVWVLRHDCALDFKSVLKGNFIYLYGVEFEGGNFFKNFFKNKNLKRFNNGALFCVIELTNSKSMSVKYMDKNFLNALNKYLNNQLCNIFKTTLNKVESNY